MNDSTRKKDSAMEESSIAAARSVAIVHTEHASRYLQQLCKHFAHKLPVTFDAQRGHVRFSIGDCELSAIDGRLQIGVAATSPADLPQLQGIVARHLVRFAFREELVIEWQNATETGPLPHADR